MGPRHVSYYLERVLEQIAKRHEEFEAEDLKAKEGSGAKALNELESVRAEVGK